MARDQDTIPGGDKVGFDEVCTLINGELISSQGVLGSLATGTAMGNHKRADGLRCCGPRQECTRGDPPYSFHFQNRGSNMAVERR